MFKPVDTRFNVPALEHEIIRFWEDQDIEAKYLKRNENSAERFSFIDGPITANGVMGVHHAWGRTYKDVWQRYHTMLGHKQRYQNGFDCQGLWVEVTVEQELKFNSKRDIEAYGIAEFVRKCKASTLAFAEIQTLQSKRLGQFMDWDNSYYTMSDENNYTVWLFLKTCHEKGWLYKGTDVMPWCVRCGTGISEQEIATTEYEEVTHTSVYVKFPLLDKPGESLLVWTTTPWTLTSNVAAAVNPGKDPVTGEPVVYVKARRGKDVIYAAREALPTIGGEFEIIEELAGEDMLGWRYGGPFDELPAEHGIDHRVIPWDQVGASEGTGIVHIAPGAGKEDFALSKEMSLPAVAPLDENGIYVDGFDWLSGRDVMHVSDDIVENLRGKGILFRAHKYSHRYPTCWRCHTQLVFRLVDEWFISMDELRQRMMRAAEQTEWIPSWCLDRELDWLRNMQDWMISKKRYWGLALPIYECECGNFDVLGGKADLEARAIDTLDNLESPHRPWVDEIRIRCSACDQPVSRVKDVGNVWLDAGIVPFSTLKYAEDRDYWREWFPGDFITESFPGQFRNWFYSLIAQSAALEDTNSIKTIFGYALLRDENGREMHKSWGNAIPFDEAADQVGADIMRWLFTTCAPETNTNFGFSILKDVTAKLLILWNTYSFFVTYANIDGFDPSGEAPALEDRTLLDRWIIARLQQVVLDVRHGLDNVDCAASGASIETFIEDLSTWYVRRSRRRFWKSGTASTDTEKASAYFTLYECLHTLTLLLAPFTPHLAEDLYQNLVKTTSLDSPESVHLCDFPVAHMDAIDNDLVESMAAARKLVSLGRAARDQEQIKVRQPLGVVYAAVPTAASAALKGELREIILEELNVKELRPAPPDADFVDYRIRPNLPVLGKRYGKLVSQIRDGLAELPPSRVADKVHAGESVEVKSGDHNWILSPDEILVEASRKPGFAAAAESGYLIALDTTISPELRHEGLAREFVRAVNDLRKDRGLKLDDRISITYADASDGFKSALAGFGDWIASETLAENIHDGAAEATTASSLSTGTDSIRFDLTL